MNADLRVYVQVYTNILQIKLKSSFLPCRALKEADMFASSPHRSVRINSKHVVKNTDPEVM